MSRDDLTWHRGTAVILVVGALLCGGIIAHHAVGQSDRAAFDRARERQRLQAQPTYAHNPVVSRWGQVAVNMHEVMAYHPGDVEGTTVLYPGGMMLAVPFDEFDVVMRRYTRAGAWRPTPAPQVP